MLTVFLVFAVGCGKSGDNGQGGDRNSRANPGEKKPESKRPSDGEIDIDSLDIPDQMKEAIKSGKIPPDQVKESGNILPFIRLCETDHKRRRGLCPRKRHPGTSG